MQILELSSNNLNVFFSSLLTAVFLCANLPWKDSSPWIITDNSKINSNNSNNNKATIYLASSVFHFYDDNVSNIISYLMVLPYSYLLLMPCNLLFNLYIKNADLKGTSDPTVTKFTSSFWILVCFDHSVLSLWNSFSLLELLYVFVSVTSTDLLRTALWSPLSTSALHVNSPLPSPL